MENIKLHEYLRLSENDALYYATVFQFIKGSDTIGKYKATSLTSLSFGNVASVKNLAHNADFTNVFVIVFGIPVNELINIRVKEFFMALNWLKFELAELVEREKHLVGDEEPDMIEAGSARLNVFKEMNILIPLSKEYGMTPEQIEGWKYSTVFTIMYHDKVSRDIEKAYNKIVESKIKR